MLGLLFVPLLFGSVARGVALTGTRSSWSDPYSLRPNPLYPYARSLAAHSSGDTSLSGSRFWKNSDPPPSRTRASDSQVGRQRRQDASEATQVQDTRPTPEPTGDPSPATTVHITTAKDFALLLPTQPGELVSDAEADGQAYCTPESASDSCHFTMPEGLITASSMQQSDDGSWIQVTGCLDASKFHFDPNDSGGQMDVRFPNGAQCTFGGYGASFIELVEPRLNRFCLRCCSSANDQVNCNSHQDRLGCENAVPGQYDFPDLGVSCA
ncbi:hypothetical protein BC834DRAFT_876224 [Gloeopeniophorella convolvens]|nr:hypothetical protein BC834DRAFT_876224 [Gloeopeniophorella convolvens]